MNCSMKIVDNFIEMSCPKQGTHLLRDNFLCEDHFNKVIKAEAAYNALD